MENHVFKHDIRNVSWWSLEQTTISEFLMEIQASQQLVANRCKPCEGGVSACALDDANAQLEQLVGWRITHDGKRIRKEWTLNNFMAALDFVTRVAEVSENEGHHPDLHLEGYRNV